MDESQNQNNEQVSIEPEKHSEPIHASSEQQNDQIQQVTESIGNMNNVYSTCPWALLPIYNDTEHFIKYKTIKMRI